MKDLLLKSALLIAPEASAFSRPYGNERTSSSLCSYAGSSSEQLVTEVGNRKKLNRNPTAFFLLTSYFLLLTSYLLAPANNHWVLWCGRQSRGTFLEWFFPITFPCLCRYFLCVFGCCQQKPTNSSGFTVNGSHTDTTDSSKAACLSLTTLTHFQ